jgi:CRISPR type I-F-associated protein Csy2
MPSLYIVIKDMTVINANLSSSYFSADLSQNAYLGFAHHLARFLDEKIPNKKNIMGKYTKAQLGKEKCFAIIKHLEFNQGHASYAGHLNDNNHKALNIPMNPPEIKGTLKQTVVIQLQVRDQPKQLHDWMREFLLFNRFSGGDIQYADYLNIEILKGDEKLKNALQWEKGWVAKDATQSLVDKAKQTDYSTAFCDFLSLFKITEKGKTKKEDKIRYERHHKGWFYASLAGYQLLESPKKRHGARYGHDHAYAEPIIGLHTLEYFDRNSIQPLFWYGEFKNHVYHLKQGN